MPRDIQREVTENRRKVQRLETYYRQPAPQQTLSVRAPEVRVELTVSATVYTRPVNDTLVGGHPDASNQPGRATVGDRRGSWSQVATSSASAYVDDGRRALAEALTGAAKGVTHAEAGSGTSDPSASDTDLDSGASQVGAWYDLATADTIRWLADFRFDEFGDVVNEVGLWTEADELVCRLTTGGVDPTASEELKLEVEITVTPDTGSAVAVTDATAISNALASPPSTVGLDAIALGTDGTDPTTSDTTLGNAVVQKSADHETGAASVTPWTIVFRSEPSTQPHDIREIGVFDETGTLAWRAVFAAETKNARTRMRPQAALRIQ